MLQPACSKTKKVQFYGACFSFPAPRMYPATAFKQANQTKASSKHLSKWRICVRSAIANADAIPFSDAVIAASSSDSSFYA